MKELNLEQVKTERGSIEDEYDLEAYDFKMFKNCQSSLDALHSQLQDTYEYGISDFGEAIADGKALSAEYKYLKKAYHELHDRLYPIMRETYKGYKAHSEWCRIGYTYIEEFEKDEDDIYSLLGLD